MGVTSSGQDLEDTVVDGQEGDIEGTTTEIVDDDLRLAALLVETVRDGGGRGLVDDTEDLETGDRTGVLGRLALRVVEVCKTSQQEYKREGEEYNAQAGTVTTAWVTFSPR